MSKISDMYEQIKLQQYQLVETKLKESIKADREKRELSEEEREDYKFDDNEEAILINLLKEQGLEPNKDFIELYESGYSDEPTYRMLILKSKDGIISIFTQDWPGIRTRATITSIEDLGIVIQETFSDVIEETIRKVNNLNEIDIEQLQIGTQTMVREEKVEGNLIDKLRIIEKSDDIDRIPAKLFTDDEIESLIEILKDKENFVTYIESDYTISDSFERVDISNVTENSVFNLKDKIVKIIKNSKGDIDLEIKTPEAFLNELAYLEDGAYGSQIENFEEYDFNLIDKGITIEEIEEAIKSKEEINLIDLVYDLNEHKVIEYDENEIDIDYVNVAGLGSVIHHAIRGELIDTMVNAQYNEYDNYYTAGEYSDMPGEEEIVKILNSIDRKIIAEYFNKYPEDIALFEEMKDKYHEIQSLEENEKLKNARQLFEKSLLRDDVVEYYLSKTPEELQKELGPEVARMVGFEQKNSHHCYDLWEHTLRTVEGIKSEGLTPEQFKKLRVAAFFHDIGKPDVAKFNEKTGQQVFYGHANHSVDVAKPILEKLGYSEKEVEELGFYIGHHDDFISYKSEIAPWMKNHEFIRGIDSSTVSEKIIENQYNFQEMEYDKDQIRYICYTLGHDREEPVFMTQDGPMNLKVDMVEVQEKIDSGDYDAKYVPTEEDYKLLLELCKADAGAQSEVAMQQGKQVGSKKEKLENMDNIQKSIPEAFKLVEKVTGYTFEQFIKDSVPQTYGEKRPMVICKDGTECSIQASSFHACLPQKDGLESYEEFEIGNIAEGIAGDLEKYLNYDGVAGNVPKEVIEEIVKAHGGLDKKIMKARVAERKEVYKPKDNPLERQIQEISGGNEFIANMLRYATRKCEVRDQNEKAEKLCNDYEEMLPKNEQSLNDED